mmetsp:Transcript_95029/g.307518  ORF Transcript_95029/g.307518 Transcript_95029/m.307518 type:complete len:222 (+) Transcript_95029:477-1142(+)
MDHVVWPPGDCECPQGRQPHAINSGKSRHQNDVRIHVVLDDESLPFHSDQVPILLDAVHGREGNELRGLQPSTADAARLAELGAPMPRLPFTCHLKPGVAAVLRVAALQVAAQQLRREQHRVATLRRGLTAGAAIGQARSAAYAQPSARIPPSTPLPWPLIPRPRLPSSQRVRLRTSCARPHSAVAGAKHNCIATRRRITRLPATIDRRSLTHRHPTATCI